MHKISCVKNVQSKFIHNNQDWKNWNVHYQVWVRKLGISKQKNITEQQKKEWVSDILNSMDKI